MITLKNEPKRYEGVENRVQMMALVLALVFAVPCYRLWTLQVVEQSVYQSTADDQRIWEETLDPARGIIYGKDDVILADNRASVNIVFTPGECPEARRTETCLRLADLLGLERNAVLEKVEKTGNNPFKQVIIKSDVPKTALFKVEEHGLDLPGVAPIVRPQRRYLYRETGGQLLGYLGWQARGENQGDVVGLGGLESQYEDQLQGEDGFLLVTQFARGRPQLRTDRGGMPVLAKRNSAGYLTAIEGEGREPRAGDPLHLTLDIGLQAKCESLLQGQVGAMVVLEADSGAVLAMASVPSFDPSVFVSHDSTGERMRLLEAKKPKPMLSRAYREQYPPGSVFKVMLAAAALEEGIITTTTSHFCGGGYKINGKGRTWHCWKRHGHGHVAVKEALAYSCDVYFYNVGLALGVDKIQEWAHRMGMGVKTGIDLPRETKGLIPGRAWKAELNKGKPIWDQNWYPGETVNLSIGQGSAATTPLQNAIMMACIVNGGYRVTPYLNRDGDHVRSERFLSDSTVKTISGAMRMCVEKAPPDYPTGTGWRAGVPGIAILGKTGSAQIMNLSHHEEFETEEDIPYLMRDHAWFVAGVVEQERNIAICILVEHGHHGSTAASVLAKPLIEYIYRDREPMDVQVAQAGGPSP